MPCHKRVITSGSSVMIRRPMLAIPKVIAIVLAFYLLHVNAIPTSLQHLKAAYVSFGAYSRDGSLDARSATQVLLINSAYTLRRLAIGLFVGGVLGTSLGLLANPFAAAKPAVGWFILLLKSLPLLGLIPLFVCWFSGRELGVIIYVSFSVLVVVATAVYESTSRIRRELLFQAKMLGANRKNVVASVVIPSILPDAYSSFRWATGMSLAFTLGAEYTSSGDYGLGVIAYRGYLYANTPQLLVLAFVFFALGLLLLALVDYAWRSTVGTRVE